MCIAVCSQGRREVWRAHPDEVWSVVRLCEHGLECVCDFIVHERHPRPGVLIEIPDLVRLELRVDHHNDTASSDDPEEGRDEVEPVRHCDQHSFFRPESGFHEQVGVLACAGIDFAVRQSAICCEQRCSVGETFGNTAAEEVLVKVQAIRHGFRG
jgi:hypothetical protein